jgi:hypothetical protein
MDQMPTALPVEIAREALARELAQARARHGADMGIGEMSEEKCHAQGLIGFW